MKIIKSRIFKALIVLFIVGILLGIVSNFIIINSKDSIINYFYLIKNNDFNYLSGLIISVLFNYKYAILIWALGIIFIFSFIIPFIIVFRGICLGFTIYNVFYCFKLKGLILSLILMFPCTLINEITFLLLGYYSINFSFKCIEAIKNNKSINLKLFTKNYLYILLVLLIILLISSFFEVYITSNLIKFVI